MAGYSTTPLWKKLGIQPAMTVYAVHPPNDYADLLDPLPAGARIQSASAESLPRDAGLVHLFVADRETLDRDLAAAKHALAKDATLWISWPKKAAKKLGIETDIDEGHVRAEGLAIGLVDVKICAVDEIWSGLKFVYRLVDRRS